MQHILKATGEAHMYTQEYIAFGGGLVYYIHRRGEETRSPITVFGIHKRCFNADIYVRTYMYYRPSATSL